MGEQTQQKERAIELKVASFAHREAAKTRVQADPVSGLVWPNGSHPGPSAYIALDDQRTAMGLTPDTIGSIISERCAALRTKKPRRMPWRLAYFTGAMGDIKAAENTPFPSGPLWAEQSGRGATMDHYKKILRLG